MSYLFRVIELGNYALRIQTVCVCGGGGGWGGQFYNS